MAPFKLWLWKGDTLRQQKYTETKVSGWRDSWLFPFWDHVTILFFIYSSSIPSRYNWTNLYWSSRVIVYWHPSNGHGRNTTKPKRVKRRTSLTNCIRRRHSIQGPPVVSVRWDETPMGGINDHHWISWNIRFQGESQLSDKPANLWIATISD